MIAGVASHPRQFGEIPWLERAGISLMALFYTSQAYKNIVSEQFLLPIDLTLVYALVSIAIMMVVLVRRGGLARYQLAALGGSLLGLYLFPTLYLIDLDASSEYAFEKFVGFYGFTLLSLVFPVMYLVDYQRLRYFLRWLMIASVIAIVFAQVDALLSGAFLSQGFRSEGLSANVILLSRIEAGAALLAFLQWRSRDPVLPRQVCLAIFLAMVFAALVTASRGPLYGMVLILIAFRHTNVRDGLSQVKRFALLLVVFGVGYLLVPYLVDVLPEASTSKLVDTDSSVRLTLWKEGIRIFAQNPIGVGFGEFSNYTGAPGTSHLDYPHNIIIEYFAEIGLAGGACLLVLLAWIGFHHKPSTEMSDAYTQSYVMFAFVLLQAMVSGDMGDNRLLFCFIAIELLKNNLPARYRARSSRRVDERNRNARRQQRRGRSGVAR